MKKAKRKPKTKTRPKAKRTAGGKAGARKKKAQKKPAKKKTQKTAPVPAAAPPLKRALARGGIRKSDLITIRKKLVEQREQVLDIMRRTQRQEVERDVGDEADQAGLSIERELQFELSDNERTTLDQIEGALRKMDKGTYGACELCRLPIEKLRIKAVPFARYCIQCQNTSERASATLL
ncbi:MAG: TraR/DksA C4-type zinc finger protein [Elusimicrobiota bacterium]